MNNNEDKYFTITDSHGKSVDYEILFTFDSEETHKSYIVFTDNKKDSEGNTLTYAATYEKDGSKLELNDIETEQEWNLVENLLGQIEDKIEE